MKKYKLKIYFRIPFTCYFIAKKYMAGIWLFCLVRKEFNKGNYYWEIN